MAASPGSSLRVEVLEPRLLLSGEGLAAQYFHNDDFTGLADSRLEAVAHDWGTGSPGSGIDGDTFSVRWIGQVKPRYSDRYTFSVLNDEAVRVWVDGQLIVDDWTSHSRRYSAGSMELQGGTFYDIRIDYREGTGAANIALYWFSASQPFEIIPLDRLYSSPEGLLGQYTDSTGGSLTRIDPTVQFDWNEFAPAPKLEADHFSVAWSGWIRADYSEPYTFSARSDGSVRLWIGNEVILVGSATHSASEHLGTTTLEAGKWYDLRLEYATALGTAQVELSWSGQRQTGAGNFEVVPTDNVQAMKPTRRQFVNPLGPGADPYVVHWENSYYLVRSSFGSVWIDRSPTLETIHASTPESDSVLAWSPPPGTNYSRQVWAPELHQFDGKWYIYVAASDGDNATHRMHVLERDSPDPFGPFVYKGEISPRTNRWAIDGTVLQWQGNRYFIWSGWPGFSDGRQNLYIAEMESPWQLRGDRVLLSTPQYDWEKHGLAINEGPQILIHEGRLHIVYSASGFWTPQYALGRLTYRGTGSLLDPTSWVKSPQPVFQATSEVVGTGHGSFTTSPDGSEHWMVYHAHANPTVFRDDRVIRMQPFTFTSSGIPHFGQPVSNSERLDVPTLGPDPQRTFLSGDFNADRAVDVLDYEVWKRTFGATVFPGVGADANGDGVVNAADYTIWRNKVGAVADRREATPAAALESTLAPKRSASPDRLATSLDSQRTNTAAPFTANALGGMTDTGLPSEAPCHALRIVSHPWRPDSARRPDQAALQEALAQWHSNDQSFSGWIATDEQEDLTRPLKPRHTAEEVRRGFKLGASVNVGGVLPSLR